MKRNHYRTVWLSDVHLGYRDCRAEFLLDFLARTRCETLYLVGDIVDLWALKRSFYWPRSHHKVLKKLIKLADKGTRVVYVPGNHDSLSRDIVGQTLLNIEVHRQYVHETADGRRFLLCHGDEFEHAVLLSRWHKVIGNAGYFVLLLLNRWNRRLRKLFGLPYWSLSTHLKNRSSNARRAIDAFERAAAMEARERGLDGVICGHIHQPEIRPIDGTLYCNDGDWVENCTALVENDAGWLELVHWGDRKQAIKGEPLPSGFVDQPLSTAAS